METLLVAIILISLGLAAVMSAVAWRLLRAGRDRATARVAALETLARSDGPNELDAPVPAVHRRDRVARRPPLRPSRPEPVFDDVDEDLALDALGELPTDEGTFDEDARGDDEWDLPIRPGVEPAPAGRRAERGGSRRPDRPSVVRTRQRPAAVAEDLFASAAVEPSRPGWQGMAAALTAIVVLIVGTGVVYAVRSTDLLTAVSRRVNTPDPASLEPIELLSLRHHSDPTGTFTVTGLVGNPASGTSLTNVVAVIYLFDDKGRYFATGRATLELTPFRPGDQSPFVVTVPNAGMVNRYRVGFRFEDGGVVAHVDQRGQPLRGTSGDAVNGVDRSRSAAPAGPHRVEG